ncbi:MAG: 50S ribosomal protein L11 methyltransferase [Anaerolineales bacterium]|nr:50S ribosomal protein L11 methyltransferase [Anaerolineales bacterium]
MKYPLLSGELPNLWLMCCAFWPNGVMTEQGVKFNDEEDEGTATGPITVRAYLEVNDQLEETRQKLEESLYYLGMIKPVPPPTYKQIADQNWMEAWKQHYKPILIGQGLLILPAWLESPSRAASRSKLTQAWPWTGTHPTTQLCLELMRFPDNRQLLSVIDVGCGSGILSIAALKLGANKVLGVDIDIESVKNSRENADTNEVGEELILGQGSVTEVL